MENLGVRVLVNGKEVYKAGLNDPQFILSTILNIIKKKEGDIQKIGITTGGFNITASNHVSWPNIELKEGDKISYEIITGPFDDPSDVRTTSKLDQIELLKGMQNKLKNS
ncbi:MAG: hypothetical protein HRU40_21635 [Saprospiraceae bacterium]|nr:hypothetical protein [Saprospiraceae bacterium]